MEFAALKYIKYVLVANKHNIIMGIVQSIIEWFRGIESHYNAACTYNQDPYNRHYWTRHCVCKRNLSHLRVSRNLYTEIRSVQQFGRGRTWYELSWIEYNGRDFTSLSR